MNPAIRDMIKEKSMPIPNSGCWLWIGITNPKGYGITRIPGIRNPKSAHRVSYEEYIGKIPDGLEIDHKCRVKGCVNPDHLEAVTHSENMRRANPFTRRVMSGMCIHGHLLDGTRTRDSGGRYCKTCTSNRKRKKRAG